MPLVSLLIHALFTYCIHALITIIGKMKKSTFCSSFQQEAAEGTNVTQIIGIDRNPNDDRVLSYGFVPSEALADDMNRFSINPATGVITVQGKLDRESKELYEVKGRERDQGREGRRAMGRETDRKTDM